MADNNQLKVLKQSFFEWNKWFEENSSQKNENILSKRPIKYVKEK